MRRFLFAALILVPTLASAHGDDPSFEKEVGPYLVDVGFDTIGFRPHEAVTFDFDLLNTSDRAPAFEPFDAVNVEIGKDGRVLESRTVQNDRNFIPTMTYSFPMEGDYSLYVAYVQSGSIVVQTTFDVPVGTHNGYVGRWMKTITPIAAIGLVLFAAYVALQSFRKRKAS